MSLVGALTSGLGNAYNYLSSCCTKRAAVTTAMVASFALIYFYRQSLTEPEEEEVCPPLTNRGNGVFCNEDEGYCYQKGDANFDLFVKMMEKALEVIKGCPASDDLFEEVKEGGPVVFEPVNYWELKFSGEEGNNVVVNPNTLKQEKLPAFVTEQFFRLLPQAKKDWEDIKDGACAAGPGPYSNFASIETFIRNCLRFDQRMSQLYHYVAEECVEEGYWKPKLDLYRFGYNLLPWHAFDGYYEAVKSTGRHDFFGTLRNYLC